MKIGYALLSLLAVTAMSAFVALGNASSTTLVGQASASASLTQTPTLTSDSAAFVSRAISAARKLSDAAQSTARAALESINARVAHKLNVAPELPSAQAAKAADEYGVSTFAAQAILGNAHVRQAIAGSPIHGGAVEFESPFGTSHQIYRSLEPISAEKKARILVDVDNVVGAYWEQFRKMIAEFLDIDKRDLPANPSSYDWAEGSTPIRDQFFSGEPLSPNLRHFRDWMEANDMLEGFLKPDAGFFEVFNPFHRYFVEQGLYRKMDAFPGAREGLKSLREIWDIGIVTKRWGHDPVRYGWTSASVPSDSARWISEATDNAFDSLTVMGENKADFAGHVRVVFEDSVGNIEKVRSQNAPAALRERALAAGVSADGLDNYLAQNNTGVLGVVFRYGYNDNHRHLKAPNVVAVDSWDEAHAVARAYHYLQTNPEAAKSGKLHWSEVPGLSNVDGTPIASFGGKLIAEDAPRAPKVLKLNGWKDGDPLPYGLGGYDSIPEHLKPKSSESIPPSNRPNPSGFN